MNEQVRIPLATFRIVQDRARIKPAGKMRRTRLARTEPFTEHAERDAVTQRGGHDDRRIGRLPFPARDAALAFAKPPQFLPGRGVRRIARDRGRTGLQRIARRRRFWLRRSPLLRQPAIVLELGGGHAARPGGPNDGMQFVVAERLRFRIEMNGSRPVDRNRAQCRTDSAPSSPPSPRIVRRET